MVRRVGVRELKTRLAVQSAVADVLARAPSLRDATSTFLGLICGGLGWDYGALWEVDRATNVLRCVTTWLSPEIDVVRHEAMVRGTTFVRGQGLLGMVWESGTA